MQIELRRVGCYAGSADGDWGEESRASLEKFNRYAHEKLDIKLASLNALGVIKSKTVRVCPLICRHGYRAEGDTCARITCGAGKVLNDDDECVSRKERRSPTASREREERRPRHMMSPAELDDGLDAPPVTRRRPPSRAGASTSPQIVCGDNSCRPVRPGCHIEYRTSEQGGSRMGGGSNVEICN